MVSKQVRQMAQTTPTLTRAALLGIHLSLGALSLSAVACRVTTDDVQAWAKKSSGPRKLVAVVQHDKYPTKLRIEAATTLVTMPPRGGHALGLMGDEESIGLLVGLKEMKAADRALITSGLIPRLEKGMLAPIGDDRVDHSFAYKDAAFALLTLDGPGLVSDPRGQKSLKLALVAWCQNNFVARMDDTTQLYGMEQVLRYLGADGVRGLTPLINTDFKKLRQLAALIQELGDGKAKLDASQRMVKVARFVDSEAWVKKTTHAVQEANKASGLTVSQKQLDKQLEAFQAEELQRVFAAMKSVGQKPAVDYFLGYAIDKQKPEKQRAAALAALEGHLDPKNPAHAKAMLDLLSSDETPDLMRDMAARRIGELSRDQVVERLYALFNHPRWQLRWSVASLVLKMSDQTHIPEFMERLGKVKDMAMSESLSYGKLLGEIKGVTPGDLVTTYTKKNLPASVRLSALGYYYEGGTKEDLASIASFRSDPQAVPSCRDDAQQCAWECAVPGVDKATPSELKTVKTVGDFVEYCLVPAMANRAPLVDAQKNAKTQSGDKKEKK